MCLFVLGYCKEETVIGPVDFAQTNLDETVEFDNSYSNTKKFVSKDKTRIRVRRMLVFSSLAVAGLVGVNAYNPIIDTNTFSVVAQAEKDNTAKTEPDEMLIGRKRNNWVAEDGSSIEDNARKLFAYEKEVLNKEENAIPLKSANSSEVVTQRIAHKSNVAEKVDAAKSAWGIEFDVQEYDSDMDDIHLYHDSDGGYTLKSALNKCKERGQKAILDMKDSSNYGETVRIVKELEMLDSVYFQVSDTEQARKLYDIDHGCMCWFLNGAGTSDEELRLTEMEKGAWLFSGVSICGSSLSADEAADVVAKIHSWNGFGDKPLTVCLFSYGETSSVYDNDAAYKAAHVDYLMTELVPEG